MHAALLRPILHEFLTPVNIKDMTVSAFKRKKNELDYEQVQKLQRKPECTVIKKS